MANPLLARAALRHVNLHSAQLRGLNSTQWVRRASSNGPVERYRGLIFGLLGLGAVSGAAIVAYPYVFQKQVPQIEHAEVVFEETRKPAASKEQKRDSVSSQHLQVKKSWENPGVYAWGSNEGKVVAPDSDASFVKTPRRISYFDGQILRDLKLDRNFGVAVTENGDLVQWGTAFSKGNTSPTVTLTGKNISKVVISRDRIIALASNGSVYSVPVASSDQALQSYRQVKPGNLGWGEKVVDVSSGLDHCLLLTSKGRVYSAASSSEEFPSRGQLGIRGLKWENRPQGPYDQPHEIKDLNSSPIKAIATGDFHSLLLDGNGKVFAFGDNSSGQLGLPLNPTNFFHDVPAPLPLKDLAGGKGLLRKVTSIAAGGLNSFFTTDGITAPTPAAAGKALVPVQNPAKIVVETWACGEGIHGNLGTGKWTHSSTAPTKIKALSDLFEFDEATNSVSPIRLAYISVGSTHACAVMNNATNLSALQSASENETNFGEDALLWGGNEQYQLGTGKRNNLNAPAYIAPLDGVVSEAGAGRKESQRFQVTPRTTVRLGEGGSGRKVSVEQRVECGRYTTAVYSAA